MADTSLAWIPSAEQVEVIDMLATGYSQSAAARATGIPVTTISTWIHDRSFSEEFRAMVESRAAEYQAAAEAVHNQQVVLALQIVQEALTGELQRERTGTGSITPLRYDAAVELLRATFWKQRAGGHKQFGAS